MYLHIPSPRGYGYTCTYTCTDVYVFVNSHTPSPRRYEYTYVYVYVRVCIYTQASLPSSLFAQVWMYVHRRVSICIHVYIFEGGAHTHLALLACVDLCLYFCMSVFACVHSTWHFENVCLYTNMCSYTYIYIYIIYEHRYSSYICFCVKIMYMYKMYKLNSPRSLRRCGCIYKYIHIHVCMHIHTYIYTSSSPRSSRRTCATVPTRGVSLSQASATLTASWRRRSSRPW